MRHLKYGLVFGLLLVCLIIPCLMRTPKCCLRKTLKATNLMKPNGIPNLNGIQENLLKPLIKEDQCQPHVLSKVYQHGPVSAWTRTQIGSNWGQKIELTNGEVKRPIEVLGRYQERWKLTPYRLGRCLTTPLRTKETSIPVPDNFLTSEG